MTKKKRSKMPYIVFLLVILVVALAVVIYKLPVQEEGKADKKADKDKGITLEYGDSYVFSGDIKSVSGDDEKILKIDKDNPGKARAVECGKAAVELKSGETVRVTVEPARLTLVLFAGQSNCEGRLATDETVDTVRKRVVLNEPLTAFATYGVSDNETGEEVNWIRNPIEALNVSNAKAYLPESLTDNSKNEEHNRTDTLTTDKDTAGKTGIDSAFAYEWYKNTGEKVWIINAGHHGSKIQSWMPTSEETDNNFWQAVELYRGAEKILSREIKAGHYVLAHKGIIWCQGENNYRMGSGEYVSRFQEMYEAFEEQLNGEGIAGLERELDFCGINIVRAAMDTPDNEEDFVLTGPRSAQFYMTTGEFDEKIILAANVSEKWGNDNSVKEYFADKYGNDEDFNAAYPKEDTQIKMPTSVREVHGGFHYTQLAYNEIGFDAADNICEMISAGKNGKAGVEEIELVMEDGVTDRSGTTVNVTAGKYVPFAVKVFPASRQKDVRISCSDNVIYDSKGLMITDEADSKGNITGEVKVTVGKTTRKIEINGKN